MTPDDFTSKYKKRPVLQKARLVARASMLLSANRSVARLQGVNMSAPPQRRQVKFWLRILLSKVDPQRENYLSWV